MVLQSDCNNIDNSKVSIFEVHVVILFKLPAERKTHLSARKPKS
jgi:hypothetical protein